MKQPQNLSGRPQAPPLDHLPDLRLLAIFGYLPVAELLQRKALNVRLDGLQAEACRAQTHFNLLLGPGAVELYHTSLGQPEPGSSSTLTLGRLTLFDADRLVGQMPRVRQLVLVLSRVQEAEVGAIVRLLRGWSGTLRKLVIFILPSDGLALTGPVPARPDPAMAAQLLRLLAGINSLSHLKSLIFILKGHFLPADSEQQSLYLPVLAHLEEFFFGSTDSTSTMLKDSLARYLPGNSALARLTIGPIDEETFQALLRAGPHVGASMLRFWSAPQWILTYPQLERLAGAFPNLQQLEIHGSVYTLPMVARLLRPLKGLRIVKWSFNDLQPHLDAIQGQLQLQVGPEEAPAWAELKQVTALEVHFAELNSHQDIAAFHLELYFPNLEELIVRPSVQECTICGNFGEGQGRQDRPEDMARGEACCKATETALRQRFKSVKTVTVGLANRLAN